MSYALELIRGKYHPPKDLQPSFDGRNAIVTGANSGIGFEAAVKFVQLGAAKVVLAVRSLEKGDAARRQIQEITSKAVLEVWHVDMSDYGSIRAFSKRATAELEHLDIAVLNAGVIMGSYKESKYGFEQTMQVNVLSTALLGLFLMPKMRASRTSTHTPVLEIVGSGNQYMITTLHSDTAPFASYNAPSGFSSAPNQYGVSKLFVMYVQAALARLASPNGTENAGIFIPVVCPGATQSELGRDMNAWYLRLAARLMKTLAMRKTEEGARTYISGVVHAQAAHGKLWKDDTIREPAPLMIGERGQMLERAVWAEIVDALRGDVPEMEELIRPVGRSA